MTKPDIFVRIYCLVLEIFWILFPFWWLPENAWIFLARTILVALLWREVCGRGVERRLLNDFCPKAFWLGVRYAFSTNEKSLSTLFSQRIFFWISGVAKHLFKVVWRRDMCHFDFQNKPYIFWWGSVTVPSGSVARNHNMHNYISNFGTNQSVKLGKHVFSQKKPG